MGMCYALYKQPCLTNCWCSLVLRGGRAGALAALAGSWRCAWRPHTIVFFFQGGPCGGLEQVLRPPAGFAQSLAAFDRTSGCFDRREAHANYREAGLGCEIGVRCGSIPPCGPSLGTGAGTGSVRMHTWPTKWQYPRRDMGSAGQRRRAEVGRSVRRRPSVGNALVLPSTLLGYVRLPAVLVADSCRAEAC